MPDEAAEKRPEDKREGCIYVRPGLKVTDVHGKGRGIVSDVDVTSGEILIIEVSVFATKDAAECFRRCRTHLMPRRSEKANGNIECPRWVFGLPAWLVLKWCPPIANLLKIHLNGWWHGLFDLGSVLNHSCGPNCQRVIWKNGVSLVVASEAISAGSELTASYGWSHELRPWRRLRLFEKYGFYCHCDRCNNGAPAKVVFPAAQAELISNCDQQGLDKSALPAQAVTIFELASDDGGDEIPRAFARAIVRWQLMLEGGDTVNAMLALHNVRALAPMVGCNSERLSRLCSRGEEEIEFAAAIGPMAEAITLLNMTRCCSLVAVATAFGSASFLFGHVVDVESYEPDVCLCAAFCAAGSISGARCYEHGPFGSPRWNGAAGGVAVISMVMASQLEDGPSLLAISMALLLAALFARASAISAMRLARYDHYLRSLAKGGLAIGARYVR